MSATTLTLPIVGMSCASCVSTIERALGQLAGVEQVNVSLGAGKARVRYDPSRVGLKQLVKAGLAQVKAELRAPNPTLPPAPCPAAWGPWS